MAIRNFASEAFGPGGGGPLVPRQKFHFTLTMQMAGQAIQFTRVRSAQAASYSFDTQIANQYNKKRVVQTKVNYEPITVAFYDTHDNQWHNIWRRYMAYYYAGGAGIEGRSTLEGRETTTPSFQTDQGFTPNADRYFFTRIGIVQHGQNNRHRETQLINPIITQMQGDTLDYSDSQPVLYTVTFQPESIQTLDIRSQFRVDTGADPTDSNTFVGGNVATGQAASTAVFVSTFDSLSEAQSNSGGLSDGSTVDISGVEAVVGTDSDGNRTFLDAVTGTTIV